MSKDSNYAEWAGSWWPPLDDEPVQRLNTRPMTREQDAWFSGTLSGGVGGCCAALSGVE